MVIQHNETLEGQLFAALRDQNASTLGTILGTLLLTDTDLNARDESGLTPLEAAFDMDGAFNDIALTLASDGRIEEVIEFNRLANDLDKALSKWIELKTRQWRISRISQ